MFIFIFLVLAIGECCHGSMSSSAANYLYQTNYFAFMCILLRAKHDTIFVKEMLHSTINGQTLHTFTSF